MNAGVSVRRHRCLWPILLVGVLVAGGTGAAVAAQDLLSRRLPADSPDPELWVFFSPEERRFSSELGRLAEVLRRHPELRVRPVFLTEDWAAVKKPSEDLADTIKAVQALGLTLRLWDDKGLAMARDLGITRLPAYAIVDPPAARGPRRVRLATGYGVKFEELVR